MSGTADDGAAHGRAEAAYIKRTLPASAQMLNWLNTGNGIVAKNTAH